MKAKGFFQRRFKYTFLLVLLGTVAVQTRGAPLAAFQTADLIEGNHCLYNEFA